MSFFQFLILLFTPVTLLAQVVGQPYRVTDREVEQVIKSIEQTSDRFRSSLDSALDKSRFDGSSREDDINAFVKSYYETTKTLRHHFDDHKSTSVDVQAVLDQAARIDSFMRRQSLSARAQEDWSAVKVNLDQLAGLYSVNWRWGNGIGIPTGPVGGIPYRLSDHDLEKILKRIEQQSDRFRSSLDSTLDKSRLDGTRHEDEINAFVKEFYESTKTLRNHFDDHKSTSNDVQNVLDRAARIDDFLRRNPLRGNVRGEWDKLRSNLDELARAYEVSWRWGI